MTIIKEGIAQANELFFKYEEITKEVFKICQSLSLKNEEDTNLVFGEKKINIVREDIKYSGGLTERYFLQEENTLERAEVTKAGVFFDDGNKIDNDQLIKDPDNKELIEKLIPITTYQYKVEKAEKVLGWIKDIPKMI